MLLLVCYARRPTRVIYRSFQGWQKKKKKKKSCKEPNGRAERRSEGWPTANQRDEKG